MNMQSHRAFEGHRSTRAPAIPAGPERVTFRLFSTNYPELPVCIEVRDNGRLFSRSYHPSRYWALRTFESDRREILDPVDETRRRMRR